MRDFRDQLAAIRPGVTKSAAVVDTSDRGQPDSPRPKGYGKPRAKPPHNPTANLLGKYLDRLPWFGRIERHEVARRFGAIRTANRSLFFHITGKLSASTVKNTEDLSNRLVVYAIGSSEKDGRERAVQWALVDEVPWPDMIPSCQEELDTIRRKWLQQRELRQLLSCVKADWYQGSLKNSIPSADLMDPVLESALKNCLICTLPEEWRSENVRDAIRVGRYAFLDTWDWTSSRVPTNLLRDFSAKQLGVLGEPRHDWLATVAAEFLPMLCEWACRSALALPQAQKWRTALTRSFTGDSNIATGLLESSWQPTSIGVEWVRRLVAERKIEASEISKRLRRYPEESKIWLASLPMEEQLDYLISESQTPEDLVKALEERNSPELDRLALQRHVISVDIESDGHRIWEMGIADSSGQSLLLSRDEPAQKLNEAIAELVARIDSSRLVIGHNIIAWDWPTLAKKLSASDAPVLWDTMLVEFMLTPWKTSYSLGGSHRADEDAAKAFQLFQSQLERIDASIGRKMLLGTIPDTATLVRLLGEQLESEPWEAPAIPGELIGHKRDWTPGMTLVVHPYWIERIHWVPDISVVTVDDREPLTSELMPVGAALPYELERRNLKDDPFALALHHVQHKAQKHDIALRPTMLPLWITEREELEQAIFASVMPPPDLSTTQKIAKYPSRVEWYKHISSASLVFLDPPESVFVAETIWCCKSVLPEPIQSYFSQRANLPQSGTLHRTEISTEPRIELWVMSDPTALRLSKSGKCFRTIKTVESLRTDDIKVVRSSFEPKLRPRLLARAETSLYPGSQDQSAYWSGVILGLQTVSKNLPTGVVPVLLVVSSISRELLTLLEQCLCELSMAVPYKDHHSRKDRLLMAGKAPGACLLGTLDSWSAWQVLGADTGISLCPVIESLPIADWFATTAEKIEEDDEPEEEITIADETDQERDEPDEMAEDEIDDESTIPSKSKNVISGAALAARTPQLVIDHIRLWLRQSGLDAASQPCIILDPRVSTRNKSIRQSFECLDWKDLVLSDDQNSLLDQLLEELRVKREPAPSDYESMRSFLETHWNRGRPQGDPSRISDFRKETQQPALEAIRDRASDVLVSLPTGEGKSVLFQVPALCKGLRTRRLSIVISPLRALMCDQVQRLHDLGFHQSVDYLSADRPMHEIDDVYQGILEHRIILLYVAPERFRNKRFMEAIDRRYASDGAFEYVVIDEAHCVSQWGYEFRPDYFHALSTICDRYRQAAIPDNTPLLLLSATVTAANRDHLSSLISGNADTQGHRYLDFKARPEQYFHPVRSHIEIRPTKVPGKINIRAKQDWPIAPRLEVILPLIDETRQNKRQTGQHSSLIIFVSRRDHAEELSFILAKKLPMTGESTAVDYFHAGLDSASREEVYQRFLKGKIDVLVATKAFGMGMDIPHIHWAAHLAPPTFLEDYLQEVGRIGRGEGERKSAKLEQLTAALLFSQEDFESNRTSIQQNKIELLHIADLYKAICDHAKQSEDGVLVTMMPDSGFSSFDTVSKQRASCVQARKMLYWLERLGRVEILAMMPALLPVCLDFPQLGKIAETENGSLADVAKLLQTLTQPRQENSPEHNFAAKEIEKPERSFLERIIDGISRFVGMLLHTPTSAPEQASAGAQVTRKQAAVTQQNVEAIINLAQIWRETSLTSIDDVLSTIAHLEERQALKITRKIRFSRRRYSHANPGEIAHLFSTLKEIAKRVARQLERDSEYVIDFDALSEGLPETRISGQLIDARDTFERSLCYLLRSAGVRVRDQLREGSRILLATLAKKQAGKIAHRIDVSITATEALWEIFVPVLKNKEDQVIEISALLNAACHHAGNRRYREWELRRHLGLLGVMRLISVSESLVPMSYVLAVHRADEVLDEQDHPEVWTELAKVNRLTELRGDALDVFVHLPPEARDAFIRGYFEQTTADDMEEFLVEQLGQINDPDAGDYIEAKREQLRAKVIDKFLECYRVAPEEPNQWLAISCPFDRNLLVNAGPGSGKTSVLIARLAHLIRFQHIRPEEILVLAFNRAVVFEIRARIKELFGKLGYGAYVRRLDVATFHGFALRNLGRLANETNDWNKDRSILLSKFANRLEKDTVFRTAVAGGIRCLLVDEFQDVNDDIYQIIRGLTKQPNRPASVLVIGDDDQDILGWNRAAGNSSESYFRKFMKDYSLAENDQVTLRVNFRSGPQIVKHTQEVLNSFFDRHNLQASRLKKDELCAASSAGESTINCSAGDFSAAINLVHDALETIRSGPPQSVAILCRSNHEVAQAYQRLLPACPGLIVQNSVSYPVARLRHIGLWLDLVKTDLADNGDQALTDQIFERIWNTYQMCDIPEVRKPQADDLSPRQLWGLCAREISYPYLSHLIEFVEGLDSGDVVRLLGRGVENQHSTVLSTIHKVKGLEFDQVFLLPSLESFLFSNNKSVKFLDCAAEEARLQYVALTRARKSLTYFVSNRELAWHAGVRFTGNLGSGKILEGSPTEVGISWAWEATSYNPDPEARLDYIHRHVGVRDQLLIGGPGRNLVHCGSTGRKSQVGFLARDSGNGSPSSDLKVSAILRCAYSGAQYFGGNTAVSVCRQGWGLVVLAEGVLR